VAIVRCEKGHFYDDIKYSKCPHCGVSINLNTQSKLTGGFDIREGLTQAKQADTSNISDLITVRKSDDDDVKTVGIYSKSHDADPVVGWLVCTEGTEKGRDYRLHHGRNFVGRGLTMDISIQADEQISRENHFSIVYDPKTGIFTAVSGEGTVTDINDKLLRGTEELKDDDIISVGATRLVFIAFCKENRKW